MSYANYYRGAQRGYRTAKQAQAMYRFARNITAPALAMGMRSLKPYKGKSFRKGKPSRTAVKNTQAVKQITKEVKNIQRNLQTNTGYLTIKSRTPFSAECSANQADHQNIDGSSIPIMETFLTAVPYFEGGALVNVDLTNDLFQRKVHFKSISSSITLRNNRITPCECRVYIMESKADTSTAPTGYFTTGITDQMDVPALNHPMLYLSDSEQVKDMWKQVKCVRKILNCGSQFSVSHTIKNIVYDTSLYDTHALHYQKKYKNFTFVVRIEGVPSHQADSSGTIGSCDSKVTILQDTVAHLEYDSGSSGTKRIICVNNSSSQTNPVIGQTTKRIQNSAGAEGY